MEFGRTVQYSVRGQYSNISALSWAASCTAMNYQLACVGFCAFSMIKDRQLPHALEPVDHACVCKAMDGVIHLQGSRASNQNASSPSGANKCTYRIEYRCVNREDRVLKVRKQDSSKWLSLIACFNPALPFLESRAVWPIDKLMCSPELAYSYIYLIRIIVCTLGPWRHLIAKGAYIKRMLLFFTFDVWV